MIYNVPGWASQLQAPKNDIDPQEKQNNPTFCLSAAKYIYSRFYSGQSFPDFDFYSKVQTLRDYANGDQPPETYMPLLEAGNDNIGTITGSAKFKRAGYDNVDFYNIYSPAPKIVRKVIGMFLAQEHRTVATAIDPTSGAKKEYLKLKAKATQKFAPKINEIKAAIGMPVEEENTSMTEDEFNIYSELKGFKLAIEIALQQLLYHTEKISDDIEQTKLILYDLIVSNCAAKKVYKDTNTGKIKYKYIDILDTIIEYSRDNGSDNSLYSAHMYYMTVGELRIKLPEVPETELYSLSQKYVDKFGNPKYYTDSFNDSTQTYDYYSCRIPVLEFYYSSVDTYYKNVSIEINGDKVRDAEIAKGKIVKDGDKYYKPLSKPTSQDEMMYTGHWVIDSDYMFEWGLMTDIPRQEPGCMHPIVVYKLLGKSLIESIIPILNTFQLAWTKFQNAWAMAKPAGSAIDISKLSKVVELVEGFDKELDVINHYVRTGNMLYSNENDQPAHLPGQNTSYGYPFTELVGGLGTAVKDFSDTLAISYQGISELTGIDMISATSTVPAANVPVGSQEIAVASTSDTLRPYYSGYLWMRKRSAEIAASQIQTIIRFSKPNDNPYVDVIDDYLIEAVKSAGKKPAAVFGISIEPLPTKQMIQDVIISLNQLVQDGAISPAESLSVQKILNSTGNYDQAIAYMQYKQVENEKKQKEFALQQEQMKTQGLMALEEQRQKGIEAFENLQARNKAILADQDHRNRMEQAAQKADIKQESDILKSTLDMIGQEAANQQIPPEGQMSAQQSQQPTNQ